MSRTKEELVVLIAQLMQKLTPKDRTEFISKSISAQIALEEMGEDNPSDFIASVKTFCNDCLDHKYYVDPNDVDHYSNRDYYDRYYDYGDTDYTALFEESEWANQFSELLNLAIMHSRNEAYKTSNKAFDLLLNCLQEASSDETIFGTNSPRDFIEVDWEDVFKEKYISMIKVTSKSVKFAEEAVALWLAFGEVCTIPLITSFTEIKVIKDAIIKEISECPADWTTQHLLYDLLKRIYLSLNEAFSVIELPKSLIVYNPSFANDVAEGYILSGQWDEGLLTVNKALDQVTDEKTVFELFKKKVACLEQLSRYLEAYDLAIKMYALKTHHDLYLRARELALKTCGLSAFIDQVTQSLSANQRTDHTVALMKIYSYEGNTQGLIEIVYQAKDGERHNYAKYATKSLLFRAIWIMQEPDCDLKEYLESIAALKLEGVIDMIKLPSDLTKKKELILSAIDLLKGMVQFHINAASRNRYARAAYYTAIIRDLYGIINQKNEYENYYKRILIDNSRRPALKEEFKRKVGY
jgi:hypothetical protein